MANLYQASHQWSTRPDDERFESVEEMLMFSKSYRDTAEVLTTGWGDLTLDVQDDDLYLDCPEMENPAKFTHYAYGQLCTSLSVPAEFTRTLPATLTKQVLEHRFSVTDFESRKHDAKLLIHQNGSRVLRALTSEVYDRIWNADLIEKCVLPLINRDGWRVPPARPARPGQKGTRKATEKDIIPNQEDFGLSIKVGDNIAPAGLYASDHDMFAFIVHTDRLVRAGDRALMRGTFFRNSEVGDGSLEAVFFLVDNVCGNHICWGVENVHTIRVNHRAGKDEQNRGKTLYRFLQKWDISLEKYSNASVASQEELIEKAMNFEIAATKDEVIESLYRYAKSHSLVALGKARLENAYRTAELHEGWYGNPRSLWGMVSGLTEDSQKNTYADIRNDIDLQASALLKMVA